MAREAGSEVSLCVKYTLFLWNFILWIVCLCITGLGGYILYIKDKKVHDPIDFFFDPSTLMCTAGSIAVVVTFFGWLGALREYTACLRIYSWIVTIFFLGEIVLIILIFVFYFVPDAKQKLGLFPEKAFKDAIKKYGVVDDDDMKNLIDNMQKSLACCGFTDSDVGFLDWDDNEYYRCTNVTKPNPERCSVPPSCCVDEPGKMKNVLCGRGVMQYNNATNKLEENSKEHNAINKAGCLKAVGTFINDHAIVIGGGMLGVLIPQMYFMYLSRTLRQQVLAQRAKWRK
ncbi:tetraspanin-33-like isoform X2 [Dreissena polymorpha]|uniref:tetraspanin-33-like isoform X2 n=1 Tax=Dreissena polymorpha TaxID=45954 RepID=UPI0022648DC1|nr:tetraspanin-33-like isoform X2 [Dreissena polymorpha]